MSDLGLSESRILIVDDHQINVRLLEQILRGAGCFSVQGATDPRKVFELCESTHPDLLLLDLTMPHMDGFQVMEQVLTSLDDPPAVLVLTGDSHPDSRAKALSAGAHDYLAKPYDRAKIVARATNALSVRRMEGSVRAVRAHDGDSPGATSAPEDAELAIIQRLAHAASYREDPSALRAVRVSRMAGCLARAAGMSVEDSDALLRAGPLYDIGKVSIPDSILLKPGPLTPEEFETVRSHTTVGAGLLSGSASPALKLAEQLALTHHEHWDGSGYPSGLREQAIPLPGRIIATSDAFDVMTIDRPHRKSLPWSAAVEKIERGSGSALDPCLIDAFKNALPDLKTIHEGRREKGEG